MYMTMVLITEQLDKRADLEMTDDKFAKRAKLFNTPSSSSSSHEVAPNLHDSSGETEDPETRENVMKKSRVDADMEISATHKRQIGSRSSTGHCKQDVTLLAGRNFS